MGAVASVNAGVRVESFALWFLRHKLAGLRGSSLFANKCKCDSSQSNSTQNLIDFTKGSSTEIDMYLGVVR